MLPCVQKPRIVAKTRYRLYVSPTDILFDKIVTGAAGKAIKSGDRTPRERTMQKLFDPEMHSALQQLMDETIEALQLAKVSPDIDDLGATFAVALLKVGLATSFVEQKYPGFAKDVEEKRQRVLSALIPKH
jgi:hypothetical protein